VKKQKRRDSEDWKLPLKFRKPVNPQEFRFCLDLGNAAASQKMPMASPESKAINFREKNGDLTQIVIKDTPLTRVMMAISDHVKDCGGDDSDNFAKQVSIHFRMQAMGKIIEHPGAEAWSRDLGAGREIHEAVVEAASTAELNSDAEFEPNSFFELVETIATQKYSGKWA
jgi:hypothetical protein